MHDNMIKQDLSFAYALAISAKAGFSFEIYRNDHDGIDARIKGEIVSNDKKISSAVDFQIKSTNSKNKYTEYENHFTYKLKKKNYDDLRATSTTPRFLALLILPDEEHQWIDQNLEKLIIKRCMFWAYLKNEPDTKSSSDVTVKVFKKDCFTPDQLKMLLEKAAEGVYE